MTNGMAINPDFIVATSTLIQELTKENIPFEVQAYCGGFLVGFPSLGADRTGDVILHCYSYGHEYCLFEGYGKMSTFDNDVCVFDMVEDVVNQAKKFYKN